MALFKIFKGKDTGKLTDANATGYRVPTDGYAYYDTNSKLFYIDAAYGNDDTVITREAINANQALNGVFFGTCSTAQSTKAKVATLINGDGFRLEQGVVVAIKFTNASAASTMTLSVNGSTAKSLMLYETSAMSSTTTTNGWRAGAIVPFVYDGTNWVRFFWENSTYYYTSAYCTTAAGTAAKVGSSSATQTLTGSRYFQLWIQNTNTSAGALTLNMNSLGAKPIYINGQPTSSSNYNLLRGCYIVYYDATGNNGNGCYHFRTDEKIPGNLAGNADTATYATTAGSVDNETDPIFSASAAAGITSSDITNWNGKTSNTGTVTKVTAGTGLSIGSTAGGNFTTSGTINHTNSVTAQGTQALYPIKIDAQGHISAYGTAVTSLPASDVSAWAKAATKPTYAWNEISQTGADSIQEGTSDFTDNTEIFSSYASNNGFADTHAAGQVYRRDAVKMYNYIKNKLAITNNNVSVSWNTETTIATIGGTAIKIKIPANPSVLESVTASGTAPLTLSAGAITNKSIAISGSIADATKNAKGVVKIGDGISVSNGTISVTAANLGLSNAMHFLGTSSSTITDGGTETPTIGGNTVSTLAAGDVVIYGNKEFVYTSGGAWELLGPDGSYKIIQTAVESATDETTTATRFVHSVTQNANGEITVKTRPLPTYNNYSLPTASTSTKGGIKVGSGLTMSSETLNHSNSVTAQTTQAVYPIKIDAQGHISAYGTSPTTLAGYGITDSAGSATKPIYLDNGAPTECSTYAGGTAVTLNGTSKAASTASFYAPTGSGTSGYILESKGASTAPDWIEYLGVTHGGTGFKTTTTVNAVVIGNSSSATSALQTVATAQGAFYSSGTNAKPQFGTLPVNCGGTGVSTINSGEVLIGSGTSGIVTRAIKNMTAKNNLGWTSANTDNTIVTTNTMAYWNGRYNSTSSNLEYCNKGAFGDMATKTASDYIAKAIGTAKGDIIYWSSASTPARLAIGTAGHFLKATANGPAYSALTSTEVTTALGFTPYNSTNPNGYISSYTETDPVFAASAAAGITSTDITNWNNKTSNTGTITGVTAGSGLSGGGTSGSVTLKHSNSVTAQTTQAVYPIKIDAQGHISAYGSAVTIGTMAAQSSGSYVLKAGDTMTGSLQVQAAGDTYVTAKNTTTGCKVWLDAGSGNNHGIWSDGYYNGSAYTANSKWIIYRGADGEGHTGLKLYGAVWNDYAEYRICKEKPEPGRCIIEAGDDTLVMSTDRMQPGAEIVSDTFGFAIGQTEEALTPVATSGRVLAYIYEGREAARAAIGKPVCSGPNGTVSIMTDEEYKEKAYCAIGTISAVPDYEEWGSDNIKVNNRIWVRVK